MATYTPKSKTRKRIPGTSWTRIVFFLYSKIDFKGRGVAPQTGRMQPSTSHLIVGHGTLLLRSLSLDCWDLHH
eukprot:46274-Rhodomonas_salina.1